MRILVIHHGTLPTSGLPGSGGAIRAHNHGLALEAAGHQVIYLSRAQDQVPGAAPGFSDGRELRAMASAIAPERILVVQPEEARHIAGLAPVCVDLYAPRLLEAVFQGTTPSEAMHTLTALDAADFVLFSNQRQRYFSLGLMALAGMDPSLGAVVELAAPDGPARQPSRHPELLMGGVAWPWLDPTEGLRRAVTHLRRRRKGKIVVVGLRPGVGTGQSVVDLQARVPAGARLLYQSAPLPYAELLERYSRAWAALDWMAPSPEREMALAFRHVDYLGCGLPMITGAFHPLSERIQAAGAGWVGGSLEEALDQVLDDPDLLQRKSDAARALAGTLHWSQVGQGLVDWVQGGARREKGPHALAGAPQLAARAQVLSAELSAARTLQTRAESELEQKRAEVLSLAQQLADSNATSASLAQSIQDITAYRREALEVLGTELSGAQTESQGVRRILATHKADLSKKNAELRARSHDLDQLRGALAEAEVRARDAERRASGMGAKLDALARRLRQG